MSRDKVGQIFLGFAMVIPAGLGLGLSISSWERRPATRPWSGSPSRGTRSSRCSGPWPRLLGRCIIRNEGMAIIHLRIWDISGSRSQEVEAPDDVPLERLLVLLVERMSLPLNSPDGQIMSYKFHHKLIRAAIAGEADAGRGGRSLRRRAAAPAGDYRGPRESPPMSSLPAAPLPLVEDRFAGSAASTGGTRSGSARARAGRRRRPWATRC